MTRTDHLARARDYIAKGEDFYRKAAEEIVAAIREDPTLSYREIDRRLGRPVSWTAKLVQWHTSDADHLPYGGVGQDRAQSKSRAKKALRDPDLRRQVIESLKPSEVEDVIEEAHEVALSRTRARKAEHDTDSRPTARDLTGGDEFRPDEYWADKLILRVHTNARELDSLIRRGGGLILGSLSREEAFEYLQEAERQIAEARAAVQEQLRDGVEV